MTIQEKIKMYKGKKAFIDNISKAFEARPAGSTVESVEYEVYRKGIVEPFFFVEFLVVKFFGGGKSVRVVSGNSNTANFRVLGTMVEGGYSDEIRDYESLADRGFELVQFSDNEILDKRLSKPMTHISDVRGCFHYCRNAYDVERVIKMIPAVFGYFEADFDDSDEDDTFVIYNSYEENGEEQSETAEYEFYTED